ncbi:hypothetical protein B0H13DRAFT_1854533 [Mycena leptocephala]|nr:hypothetical protein B0H13DRAFT_1854533 [Mycena leptocephala]
MNLLAIATILVHISTSQSSPANKVARSDPYASITTSIAGLPHPTSTASAVVAAYEQAVENCGADVDSALQQLIPDYYSENDIPPTENVNISNPGELVASYDPGFVQWASTQPLYDNAGRVCQQAEISLDDAIQSNGASATSNSVTSATSNSVTSATSDSTTSPTVTAPNGGASVTASSSGSAGPATTSTGGAIDHRSQPILFITGVIGLLSWLG